jgi:hypothetical protein
MRSGIGIASSSSTGKRRDVSPVGVVTPVVTPPPSGNPRRGRKPRHYGKRTTGLEPATFGLGSRRSTN